MNSNQIECRQLHINPVTFLSITNGRTVKESASLVVPVHRVDGPREVARVELDGRVLLRGEL